MLVQPFMQNLPISLPAKGYSKSYTFLPIPAQDRFEKTVWFGKQNTPHSIPGNITNLTHDSYFLGAMMPELLQDKELVEKLVKAIDGKDIENQQEMAIPLGKVLKDNPDILVRLAPQLARAFADEILEFTMETVKKVYGDDYDERGKLITRQNIFSTLMSQEPASIFYWQRSEEGVLEYTAGLRQLPEDLEKALLFNVYIAKPLYSRQLEKKLNIKLIARAKQFGIKTLVTDARPLETPLLESLGFRMKGKQHIEGSIWMELPMEDIP